MIRCTLDVNLTRVGFWITGPNPRSGTIVRQPDELFTKFLQKVASQFDQEFSLVRWAKTGDPNTKISLQFMVENPFTAPVEENAHWFDFQNQLIEKFNARLLGCAFYGFTADDARKIIGLPERTHKEAAFKFAVEKFQLHKIGSFEDNNDRVDAIILGEAWKLISEKAGEVPVKIAWDLGEFAGALQAADDRRVAEKKEAQRKKQEAKVARQEARRLRKKNKKAFRARLKESAQASKNQMKKLPPPHKRVDHWGQPAVLSPADKQNADRAAKIEKLRKESEELIIENRQQSWGSARTYPEIFIKPPQLGSAIKPNPFPTPAIEELK